MFNENENKIIREENTSVPEAEAPVTPEPIAEAPADHEPIAEEPVREEAPQEAVPSTDTDSVPPYEVNETGPNLYDTREPVRTYEPEAGSGWSEPRYEEATAPQEVYSPSASGRPAFSPIPEEKPKKEKKRHGFLRFVAAALACALLSGAASYGVVNYMLTKRADDAAANSSEQVQVVLGATETRSSSERETTATLFEDGAKTANQIYTDACNFQVVGVNTSLNTTNIFGQQTQRAVSGSGFVVSEDGYILTNYHVISYAVLYGGDLTVMFEDGTSVAAEKIVGYSEDNDVAVIKIDPTGLKLNPVAIGNSDTLMVGETVYAIGNPLGELTYTMTPGIVSALDRVITTSDSTSRTSSSINMFQISAAVNSGNSGGPVYNADGEVIGIVTAKYSDSGVEGLGFAIPINDAVAIATQLIEKGYLAGASLGINCTDVDNYYSSFTIQYYEYPAGAIVLSVNEGSAAEKAGLMEGDIITALNGTKVGGVDELKMQLRKLQGGDTGTLTVFRAGKTLGSGEELELTITFDEAIATQSEPETETETQPDMQYPSGGSTFPWGYWGGR